MQRRRLLTLLAFSTILAISGCSKPEPPIITPRVAKVTSVTPKGLVLSVELNVENPNSFPLIARRVNGTLEIENGVVLGKGGADSNVSIPAKGSAVVPSQLNVDFSNIAALAPLALSEKPVPYTFRGTANIGGESLNLDMPFSVKGQLERQQILQAGMRGLGGLGIQVQ